MSLSIKPNTEQALKVSEQLALLALPRKKRIRVLKQLGGWGRKRAHDRITKQRDTEGKGYKERKSKRRRKMLSGLKKKGYKLEPYVLGGKRLELKHKNPFAGQIAALHNQGKTFTANSTQMKKRAEKINYKAPASKRIAKVLIAKGYEIKEKDSDVYRKPSILEVQQRLTQGQAGLILRILRGKKPKQSWQVTTPKRSFLDEAPENVQEELLRLLVKARG